VDSRNRFETSATMLLMRLEWLAALAVSVALSVANLSQVRWPVFIGLFVVIDAIGYLPGAIAFRRSPTGQISRGYYVAYNAMHSLLTGAALVALWALLVGPEWALLAVPIHLFGDRAIFGNTLKPFGVPFEPRAHPAFVRFEHAFRAGDTGTGTGTGAVRPGADRLREVTDAVSS
jgi:hypothetical protein